MREFSPRRQSHARRYLLSALVAVRTCRCRHVAAGDRAAFCANTAARAVQCCAYPTECRASRPLRRAGFGSIPHATHSNNRGRYRPDRGNGHGAATGSSETDWHPEIARPSAVPHLMAVCRFACEPVRAQFTCTGRSIGRRPPGRCSLGEGRGYYDTTSFFSLQPFEPDRSLRRLTSRAGPVRRCKPHLTKS
jgi:hypothetical protein